MNRALWLLIALNFRGWLRGLARKLRSVKGILLALVGLFVIGTWLTAMLLSWADARQRGASADPDVLLRYGPAILIGYCLMTVLFSRTERAIYFSPAEVNFLFTGPFTRRQLLAYKIMVGVLIGVPTTLFLTLLLSVHARWFLAAYVGLFLAYFFMQLLTLAINLIAVTVGAQAYTRGRRLFLLALAVLVAAALFQTSRAAGPGGARDLLERVIDSPLWQAVATPLRWFVEAFLAAPGDWVALAKYALLAMGVNAVLLAVVFLLDTQYLESSAAASERVYAMIQKVRRGETATVSWTTSEKARWSPPSLPHWGGIGPVAWRQMTTALRSLGRLALLVLILIPFVVGPMIARGNDPDMAGMGAVALLMMMLWLTVLLSTLVPFDFRNDVERMEVLKSLPIPAWRITVGQLLTPVVIVSVVQALVLVLAQVFWKRFDRWMTGAITFTVPFNFLMFALDNLLFLWFPSRVLASNPGDFQAVGRNVLLIVTKIIVLSLAGGVAAGLGVLAYFLTGKSVAAGLVVGWITLSCFAAALIPLVAGAFKWFDVSSDMPAS